MRRPGPLRELPLERFLPPNPNLPANVTPLKSKNKRPPSPGHPALYSPAKRRILDEEGIFSSEKRLKGPISALRARASPAKFADALRGPNSPAKKLDFGVPKNHAESSSSASSSSRDMTPLDHPTSVALSRQSVFKPESFPSSVDCSEMDDYFGSPRLSRAISRELPPDPQSTHYPGFVIHHDTRIVAEHSRSTSVEPDMPCSDSCSDSDTEKDDQKENIAPRRRRKFVAPPSTSDLNPMLSREMEKHEKARSTPATPKKNPMSIGAREGPMTPTPRRPGSGARSMLLSPGMTPVAREKERLELRRVLKVEVDEVDDEEL